MPATTAYAPPVFPPESFGYPWRTELVSPRTAHGVRHNTSFFNSPNSQTAFDCEYDIIQENLRRDIERRLEQLGRQISTRLQIQREAFLGIPRETLSDYTFPAVLVLVSINPAAISVDATPDTSIFFTADYAEKGRVYLEIFFAENLAEPVEAVVNIYAPDNRCVLAYAGSLVETLHQIVGFIQPSTNL